MTAFASTMTVVPTKAKIVALNLITVISRRKVTEVSSEVAYMAMMRTTDSSAEGEIT